MKTLMIISLLSITFATALGQDYEARTIKNTFNRETSVRNTISAPATTVWQVLTDSKAYTEWNSTIRSLEGKIAPGEKILLQSTLDEKRTFKLKVKEFIPNKKLVWGDGKGQRIFTLEDDGSGTTVFTMSEKIGGLMFPMYAKYLPSFDESFNQFAADLKKASENQ